MSTPPALVPVKKVIIIIRELVRLATVNALLVIVLGA